MYGKKKKKRKYNPAFRSAYERYLRSSEWALLRETMPGVRECNACKATMNLQLHHMIYPQDIFCTRHEHCCWLCESCHKMFHDRVGRSTIPQGSHTLEWLKSRTIRIINRSRNGVEAAHRYSEMILVQELNQRIERDRH